MFTVDFWAERLGPGQNGDNTYGNMLVQKALDDSSLGGSLFSYFVSWRADGHIAASVYFDNDPGGAGAPVRIVSTDAFPDNAPIFVALSVDGPANGHGVTLYVDGDVQGMFDATGLGSVNYGVGSMVVGANYSAARNVGFPRSFDGVVDEVQIFSSALSQADVQAIQSGGTCKETGPTVFDFDVTIDQATVRFDAQGRSDMDAFDVDGVLPLDLLAGFEPGTDEVTVGFAAYEQTLSADSFVRKDDKWALNLSPTAEGVWRVDLHDDGRFKLQANGPFGAEFGAVDFSQPVELFVSWGPYTGEATIQLDEQLHFRAH